MALSLEKKLTYKLPPIPQRLVSRFEVGMFAFAVIAALTSPWHPYSKELKIIRYAVLASGVVCGGCLLYRHRTPSKLEKEQRQIDLEKQGLWEEGEADRQRLEQERLDLYRENELIEARVQAWADSQLQEWQHQTDELLKQNQEQWQLEREMLVSQLNQVQTQLYEVTRVKSASVDSPVGWIANQVQRILSDDFGLLTSCEVAPMETGSHFLIWLKPRSDKPSLKVVKELAQELPLRIRAIKAVPQITLDVENNSIKIEIPKKPVREDKQEMIQLYDWQNAKEEAAGFIIAGNTGSAKSTVALWLLGLLTEDQPKQIIVLDVHARKNHWHEFGLPVIYEQEKVILALELILGELNRRKLTGDEEPPLIVLLDEIGALKINCQDKEQESWVNNTLLLIGAEGRKFGISLVAINQSKNVAALGIDGQNRNNYFLIMLGAGARDYADLTWAKTDERNAFVKEQAYSCLVAGCVSTQVAKHPTHGEYKRFRIKGQKPKNLKPINWLNPDINGLSELVVHGDNTTVPTIATESPPTATTAIEQPPTAISGNGGENQLTPLNGLLPLPPVANEATRERIVDCKARGMNQAETIESIWGIKKNGRNKNWLACRDIYKEVLSNG